MSPTEPLVDAVVHRARLLRAVMAAGFTDGRPNGLAHRRLIVATEAGFRVEVLRLLALVGSERASLAAPSGTTADLLRFADDLAAGVPVEWAARRL